MTEMTIPPTAKNEEFNRFVADMNEVIELLEHDLLGETYNPTKQKWENQTNSQLMNKKGAHWVSGEVRTRVNKNTFISNLTDAVIHDRINSLMRVANQHLFFHAKDYNLNPEAIPLISLRLADIVEMALYRAKNGGERDYYGSTNYNVSNTNITDQPGILSSVPVLNRFSKRRKEREPI